MSLPVYKTLEYTATLPLSQTKIIYRPYNVGDERTLLAANSAKDSDPEFYIQNTLNVIQGVIKNEDINISQLPAVDVRYLLLNQRAKSVGETIEFSYEGKPIQVHIDDFKVTTKRGKDDYKISVGNEFGVLMQELTFENELAVLGMMQKDKNAPKTEFFYNILMKCVKGIYNNDSVWMIGQDITQEEAENFIHSIPSEESRGIFEFVGDLPALAVDINIDGKVQTITDREADFLA